MNEYLQQSMRPFLDIHARHLCHNVIILIIGRGLCKSTSGWGRGERLLPGAQLPLDGSQARLFPALRTGARAKRQAPRLQPNEESCQPRFWGAHLRRVGADVAVPIPTTTLGES